MLLLRFQAQIMTTYTHKGTQFDKPPVFEKAEVEGVICNIHSLGARDFSPSYGLAPRVFVGLKSHAPIDFVALQLPIYRTVCNHLNLKNRTKKAFFRYAGTGYLFFIDLGRDKV